MRNGALADTFSEVGVPGSCTVGPGPARKSLPQIRKEMENVQSQEGSQASGLQRDTSKS